MTGLCNSIRGERVPDRRSSIRRTKKTSHQVSACIQRGHRDWSYQKSGATGGLSKPGTGQNSFVKFCMSTSSSFTTARNYVFPISTFQNY